MALYHDLNPNGSPASLEAQATSNYLDLVKQFSIQNDNAYKNTSNLLTAVQQNLNRLGTLKQLNDNQVKIDDKAVQDITKNVPEGSLMAANGPLALHAASAQEGTGASHQHDWQIHQNNELASRITDNAMEDQAQRGNVFDQFGVVLPAPSAQTVANASGAIFRPGAGASNSVQLFRV